ncbi:MAG TPA: 4Fe-4S dicluster domain-containing protein [Clostridiales bacterium]|nr:4Fe-4S dicluster domain-containing protein [Clostridiales bacterium]
MGEERIVWLKHSKCSGCNLCRLICSYNKEHEFNIGLSRISLSENDEYGFVHTICRNCEDAPCMDACPAGAIHRREDNYVVLNEKKCVSCNMCVMVCPFNAIGTKKDVNYKCDTCNGKEYCAQVCYHGAIKFGSYRKLIAEKRRLFLDRIEKL